MGLYGDTLLEPALLLILLRWHHFPAPLGKYLLTNTDLCRDNILMWCFNLAPQVPVGKNKSSFVYKSIWIVIVLDILW